MTTGKYQFLPDLLSDEYDALKASLAAVSGIAVSSAATSSSSVLRSGCNVWPRRKHAAKGQHEGLADGAKTLRTNFQNIRDFALQRRTFDVADAISRKNPKRFSI